MPWKLILFLLILTLFIVFAGFNTHIVSVSFGPIVLSNIPMFIALFVAFLSGAFIALPFSVISISKKNKIKAENRKKEYAAALINNANVLEEDEVVETKKIKKKK